MTLGIILFWSGLGRGGEWTHNQEEWNLDVGITAGGSNLSYICTSVSPTGVDSYVFKSGSEVSFTIVPQPNEFIKAFEYQVEIEKVVVRDEFLNEIDPSVIGVSYSENKLDCHSNSVGLIVDPSAAIQLVGWQYFSLFVVCRLYNEEKSSQESFRLGFVVIREELIYAKFGNQVIADLVRVDKVTPDVDGKFGVTLTTSPLVGKEVKVNSDKYQMHPPSASTVQQETSDFFDVAGRATFEALPQDPVEFTSNVDSTSGLYEGTVELSAVYVPDDQPVEAPKWTYYVRVDTVSNMIFYTDPLGGRSLVKHGDRLAPGGVIEMRVYADAQGYPVASYIELTFFDHTQSSLSIHAVEEIVDKPVYLKLGTDRIVGRAPMGLQADLTNLIKTVGANKREYAKFVVIQSITGAVGYFSSGYGYIAKYGSKYLTKKTLTKLDEWVNQRQDYQDASDSSGLSLSGFEKTINTTLSIMDGGAVVIENLGGSIQVADDEEGGRIVVLGTRTKSTMNSFTGALSNPVDIPIPDYPRPIEVALTPASGSTIAGHTPEIAIEASAGSDSNTLICRLDGILISDKMGAGMWKYQVPADRPLADGQHEVQASVYNRYGQRFSAQSIFTVNGETPAAPSGLSAEPGQTAILLKWSRNYHPDFIGYNVYRSTSEAVAGQLLGQAVEPVLLDNSAESGTQYWYRVTTVYSGNSETSFSTAVSGQLSSAISPVTPGEPKNFQASSGEGLVDLTFNDDAINTYAWKLERSVSSAGPFSDILNGGLLAGSPYRDENATYGGSYYYRLTPVGIDGVEGDPVTAGPATPVDLAPEPPCGLTTEKIVGNVVVQWNPSPENDLVGYYVWQAEYGKDFVCVNPNEPLIVPKYETRLSSMAVHGWKVTAVDGAGQVSEFSNLTTASVSGLKPGAATPAINSLLLEE